MKAVVTGAAGFIGTHLVAALKEKGYDVVPVDIACTGPHVPCSILDLALLMELFREARVVFHLAARPSVQESIEHPIQTHEVNVAGTLTVLEAAKRAHVRRLVFVSSCAIYESRRGEPASETDWSKPQSPYGFHKKIGEEYCKLYFRLYGLHTTILRLFNVYGPGARSEGPYAPVISTFIERRKKGLPMQITGDGGQVRDFVHVTDVVHAMLLAAESKKRMCAVAILNIASGMGVSIKQIADMIGGPREHVASRAGEAVYACGKISAANSILSWRPTVSLAEGIAELKIMSGL